MTNPQETADSPTDRNANRQNDVRQRLLELTKISGSSLSGLSSLIGRNSSYLQQFITKGSPRRLEERDRRTLAEFFGVAETELGAPQEKSAASYAADAGRGGARAPSAKREWVDVPRLPLGASAGPGALGDAELPFDSFRFSRRWLREQGLEAAQLSAIAVEGDSMEPVLRDGDEILVDRTPRPLRDGIHVVRLGDALMVKRLDTARPGMVVLISENAVYPPIEVALEDIEVIGRVVWKGGAL